MLRKPRILTVGSFVMDIIATTGRVPAAGQTVYGRDFHMAPGGKGANQALQCARLGAEVTMLGCVGDDLNCTEYQVSICAKDNNGPYDYGMVTRLVELAKANGVDYAVDIYPHYGSDVAAAWEAGMDARGALIGPGVHASHGMERTHYDGLKAAMELTALYLELA